MLLQSRLGRPQGLGPRFAGQKELMEWLVVTSTTLRGLLSVVSPATLNHGHSVVPSTALSVVSATALLWSSARWGVVTAASDGHLEKKSWIKILKERNCGWVKDNGDKGNKK